MSNNASYDAERQKKYIESEYARIIPYFDPKEWYEHRNLILSMKMMIEHLEERLANGKSGKSGPDVEVSGVNHDSR